MINKKYDFLIIGTGLAGLYSAHVASKYGSVAILSKTIPAVSNSYLAQGGIAASIDDADSPENHFDDTIRVGRGLCNTEAVKILVNEARDRINEIISIGMKFDSEDGKLSLGLEGGHNKRRVVHAGGDTTGKRLVEFFTKLVIGNPQIDYFENTLVYKLILADNVCAGAYSFNFDERKHYNFLASHTILATGGASGVYKRTTNPFTSIGDGITLAYNAGVEISNMEFIQFHPTAFYSGTNDTFLISEAVRGEGGYLLNEDKERFMLKIHELAELAPRDVVSMAIFNEMKCFRTSNIYLSLAHLDKEKIKTRFSFIASEAAKYGVDISTDLIPIAPASHYMIGGIKTDFNGETTLKNLYACGEVAFTGIHGANRLASNSLLECLVFGYRSVMKAKDAIGKTAIDFDDLEQNLFKIDDSKKKSADSILNYIAFIMNNKAGIVRNSRELSEAFLDIEKLKATFPFDENEYFSIKVESVCKVCQLIIRSALLREESRGGHIREDFPHDKPEFVKNIIQQKDQLEKFEDVN